MVSLAFLSEPQMRTEEQLGMVGAGCIGVSVYLGTAVTGQSLIDLINVGSHRFKTSIESVKALLLYLFKCLLGFLCSFSCCLKLCQKKRADDNLSVPWVLPGLRTTPAKNDL